MSKEQLIQNGYLDDGYLKGETFGSFERLSLGATTIKELRHQGLACPEVSRVDFPFTAYTPPKNPNSTKPDEVYAQRKDRQLHPVAVLERKAPHELKSEPQRAYAAEQALYAGAVADARVAGITDGANFRYLDVNTSLKKQQLVYIDEQRSFSPAVLHNLLHGDVGLERDPGPLAESVWQLIWHATKAEPKECLLTFVEIFVLKFLSDNLNVRDLPKSLTFYELMTDPKEFQSRHGMSTIEYYVTKVRPKIKSLFPDNVLAPSPDVGALFGLGTVVSKTSVINGFAFLRSSTETLNSFDRIFRDILKEFHKFGPLTAIDPEFKLRLYETFLKRSARQQKLGQFFTPRNVVKSIIRMARLDSLGPNPVIMDPAAGVGGFTLEPLLFEQSLKNNVSFEAGKPKFKARLIGVDIDPNLHILAKANMLLHLAEQLRSPSTTIPALNAAMAESFVLMNENETLGALLNPPINAVDVVLSNPPYVTNGSSVYKKELSELRQASRNGVDLRDYYDGCGLGIEALFLRYISGALKPSGRAFIIVPLGLLNRSEPKPKQKLLDECNILASIQLPQNTFFNTPQRTHILVVEKRHSPTDARPRVFCGIARSIGESLDWNRFATPDDDELRDIAEEFRQCQEATENAPYAPQSPLIKVVDADQFSADERWDVTRLWSDEELVALGQKKEAVSREDFLQMVNGQLEDVSAKAADAAASLAASGAPRTTKRLSMADAALFDFEPGNLIRDEDIEKNPGSIPVYSCFKAPAIEKGRVSEAWLKANGHRIYDRPFVTVNKNGASVGKVFVRKTRCAITSDVFAVMPKMEGLSVDYLAVALRKAAERGGFLYEAKLNQKRLRTLEIEVPVDGHGRFDEEAQAAIVKAHARFDELLDQLQGLAGLASEVRLA